MHSGPHLNDSNQVSGRGLDVIADKGIQSNRIHYQLPGPDDTLNLLSSCWPVEL